MSVVAGTVVIESPRAVVRTSRSRTHIPNTTYCRRAGLLGPGPDNGSQSIRIRVGWRAGDGLAHCSLLPEVAQRETEEEQEFSFHGRSGGSLAEAHPCDRWGASRDLKRVARPCDAWRSGTSATRLHRRSRCHRQRASQASAGGDLGRFLMTSRPTSPRPDLERIGLRGVYIWTEANPSAPFRPLRKVRAKFPPLAAQRAVLKKSSDDPLTFAEIE